MDLADSLGLVCSLPELPVPTHYSDTDSHANSVIFFFCLKIYNAVLNHSLQADYLQQVAYMGLKDQIVLSQARDTISIKEEI